MRRLINRLAKVTICTTCASTLGLLMVAAGCGVTVAAAATVGIALALTIDVG
jgi:hypothetical protein